MFNDSGKVDTNKIKKNKDKENVYENIMKNTNL